MPKTLPKLEFIEPALTEQVEVPPAGEAWLHEIKQDGYRAEIILEDGQARIYTRQGNDWTDRFAPIAAAAEKLKAKAAIIDGEVIVPDENGRSDFHALQLAVHRERHKLEFIAFDLLHLDGEDLRRLPLWQRRQQLQALLKGVKGHKLVFSQAIDANGPDVFAAIEQLGLEGIVSKKRESVYRSGRKSGWLKAKSFVIEPFDIIGADATPKGLPLALVAKDGRFMGHAFINLDGMQRDMFWRYVEDNKIAKSTVPLPGRRKQAVYIAPGMTARVKHLRGEHEAVRHASLFDVTLPKNRKSLPDPRGIKEAQTPASVITGKRQRRPS